MNKVLLIGSLGGGALVSNEDTKKWKSLCNFNEIYFISQSNEDNKNIFGFAALYSVKKTSNKIFNLLAINFSTAFLFFYLFATRKLKTVISQDPSRVALLNLLINATYLKQMFSIRVIVEFHGDVINQYANYVGVDTLLDKCLSKLFVLMVKISISLSSGIRLVSINGRKFIPDSFKGDVYINPPYINSEFFSLPIEILMNKKKQIVFVGSHIKLKNGDLLIDCFSDSILPRYGYELLFYGNGPEYNNWVQQANNKMLNNSDIKISFKGYIEHVELSKVLSESSLLVLPSESEGCPRVLIEAMLHNVLVIGSNIEAIAELLQGGNFGYLFDLHEPEQLTNIFDKLAISGVNQVFLECARNHAINNFSPSKFTSNFNCMLRS